MDKPNQITYNTRLLLSNEDYKTLNQYLKSSADAYDECTQYLRENNTPLNIRDVHDNVYEWMRNHYPTIPAQGIIRIYKEALSALRSIKSNKHSNAKTPAKKNLAVRLDKRLYSNLTLGCISLTGFEKNKRKPVHFQVFPKLEEMFGTYTPSDPLIFIRDGQAWLSIPFNVPSKPTRNSKALGVDLGARRFITTSDGLVIDDKDYKARRRKIRHLKDTLKSVGTKSARRKLDKVRRKERSQSKDYLYRMSKAVLESTDADIIVIEDLSKLKANTKATKEGLKRTKHNNRLSQVAVAAFRNILTYKAQLVGKRVETVSPYMTSQIDSRTGRRDGERRGCRYYCKDGVVLDADWNAAVNIGVRSKHSISNKIPKDGCLKFLIRQGGVTRPNACKPHSNGYCKPLNL